MSPVETVGVAGALGLLFGSFVGVLVSRVPSGVDVVRMRSRCEACGVSLAARDLVPLVSWVLLRGRCRACGERISAVLPAIEVATGGLFVLAAVAHDPWRAGLIAPFLGVLLALAIIDLRTLRLPDAIVLPSGAVAGVAIAAGASLHGGLSVTGALVGALGFGGLLWSIASIARRIYGEDAMGLGDVKLAALIGLVIGAIHLPSVVVAGGVAILVGGLVAAGALALGAGRRTAIPFGPMLCLGAAIAALAGNEITDAYLRLYR